MNGKSKSIGQVFQTKNYSLFKFHRENRTIIKSHVKALARSMSIHGWAHGSIVIVDSNFNVINGQHRVEAAQIANVPITYMIDPKASANEIGILHTNMKPWNIITHLERFVKMENIHYVLLDRFMKNFPDFRPTECTMLVRNGLGSAERESFETGKFEVKDMKLAYKWGHNIMSLKPYFEKGYNKSIFVRAMIKVLSTKGDVFNFEEFLHKVHLRPKSIFMCGTVEQYVEMIENIYNYRRRDDEKVNLRF